MVCNISKKGNYRKEGAENDIKCDKCWDKFIVKQGGLNTMKKRNTETSSGRKEATQYYISITKIDTKMKKCQTLK